MKYFLLIWFSILFSVNVNAQSDKQESKISADSLGSVLYSQPSISELKQILLQGTVTDPYKFHVEQQVNRVLSDSYDINSGYSASNMYQDNSFNMGKKNILGAIRSQPKFLPANELGLFGDIFLYVNAAAAGYALYQHIKRYKDEY